eukprot:scaffold398_cov198-Alexandrium_tamarense.AAC.7
MMKLATIEQQQCTQCQTKLHCTYINTKEDPSDVSKHSKGSKKIQKNNTRDSNVVPHRSTSLARQCLTSLSRREASTPVNYNDHDCDRGPRQRAGVGAKDVCF